MLEINIKAKNSVEEQERKKKEEFESYHKSVTDWLEAYKMDALAKVYYTTNITNVVTKTNV